MSEHYVRQIQAHFESFVKKHKLLNQNKLILSFSAGVDSVVLLDILSSLGYSRLVLLVHFNHLNRISNKADSQLTRKLATLYDVGFKVIKLKELKGENSNFESKARDLRYRELSKLASKNEFVLLGHHIDDSFEWSLMQKFKSSRLESSIGIPVKNNQFIRPLMCLTKKQILNYAKIRKLKWNDDPTNKDLSFERNYVRSEIIPKIKAKYPAYLKNYVRSATDLASHYNLLLLKQKKFRTIKGEGYYEILSFDHNGGYELLDNLIVKGVKHLSDKSRGSVREQIYKIKKALTNNKLGPLLLVDGIKVYVRYNHLYMTKTTPHKSSFVMNKELSYGEFLSYIYRWDKSLFSCSVNIRNNNNFPKIKRKMPFLGDHHGRVSVLNLLRHWSKEQNRYLRLRLNV